MEITYDAYGNFTDTVTTSDSIPSMEQLIAVATPFRYRGYYYDNETSLYYLNSRYYDSANARFINADGYVSTGQGFNGNNMYAYCGNNPVSYLDETGYSPDGFLTQSVVSTTSYFGFLIASIWDEDIRSDMKAINWNPFNNHENSVIDSNKVSFYKGVPTYKAETKRSGSFLAIILNSYATETTVNHEYGHNIQQTIMGPTNYGLMIGLPSWKEWSKRDYYERPWEISADILGGVTTRDHSEKDINRGYLYLAASASFGPLGYLFLLGEQ